MTSSRRTPITTAITWSAVAFLWIPVALVVLFSFHRTGGLTFPFRGLSLRWYRIIFSSEEIRAAAMNSVIIALASTLVTTLFGTLAAWGLSRTPSRWRALVAPLFFVPLTLPGLFIGIALLVFFREARVTLSLSTVTIAHLVYVLPYYLLIARAALDRLDPMLDEVATDLGATRWQTFTKVTLPQVWPVLVGAALLSFALSFDEFIITFFVIGPDSTLPMYIFSQLRRTVDPQINAIATLLLASVFALFGLTFAITRGTSRSRHALLDDLTGGRS